METSDLLNTLSNCRFYKRFEEARKQSVNVVKYEEPKLIPLNQQVLINYIKVCSALVVAIACLIIAPFYVIDVNIGNSFLLALPPILLMSFSWVLGGWWSWHRGKEVFMAATLGAMPLRMGIGLAWAFFVVTKLASKVQMEAFCLAMMLYWVIFVVPEFMFVIRFVEDKNG